MTNAPPNWVFIRGLARESAHWGNLPTRFAQAFNGSVSTCPDLPGCGSFYQVRCPSKMSAILEHIRKQIAQAQVPPPYHLITISLGGMVGLEWLHSFPNEVSRLVLINTSTQNTSRPYQRLRPSALRHFTASSFQRNVEDREKTILNVTSNQRPIPADVLESWTQIARSRPVRLRNAARQLRAALRFRCNSNLPSERILIVKSQKDKMIDPACSDRLAAFLRSSLIAHPSAGHDIPLDEPEWLIEQVQSWLK